MSRRRGGRPVALVETLAGTDMDLEAKAYLDLKALLAAMMQANNRYRFIYHGKGAVSSGARGFIGKPYQLKELDAKVREVLDG